MKKMCDFQILFVHLYDQKTKCTIMRIPFSSSGILNNGRMRVFLIVASILAPLSAMADKGDKWRVTDQDLTVWDSPNYLQKLGMIHRGYEIEEIDIDGDMIKFEYKGQTAYVATYCCEKIASVSNAGAQEQHSESVTGEAADASAETSHVEVTKTASAPSTRKQSGTGTPTHEPADAQEPSDGADNGEQISTIGWIVMGGIYAVALLQVPFMLFIIVQVFKFFFRWEKMRRRWNRRAGAPIMPERRLSDLQNPFKLVSNYSTTKLLYGKRAAKVQLCWIILSYAIIVYTVLLSLALLVYYLMFRVALGFLSSGGRSGGSSSSDSELDNQQATDVYGNSVNVHRYPNGQMMDDNGNSYSKSGSGLRRDSDGTTFS